MIFVSGAIIGALVALTVTVIISALATHYDGKLIIIPDDEDGDYMFVETDIPPRDWKKQECVTLKIEIREANSPKSPSQ